MRRFPLMRVKIVSQIVITMEASQSMQWSKFREALDQETGETRKDRGQIVVRRNVRSPTAFYN
jgi:hypothetical protein